MLTAGCLKVYMQEKLPIVIYFLRKQAVLCKNILMHSCHKNPISLGMQIVGTFTAHVCMEQSIMSTQNAKQAASCVPCNVSLKFKFWDGVAKYKIISWYLIGCL